MDRGQQEASEAGQQGDPLAYGQDPTVSYPEGDEYEFQDEEGQDGPQDRGIVGDAYRKIRGKPPKRPGESSGLGRFVGKLHGAVGTISSEIGKRIEKPNKHSHTHATAQCDDGMHANVSHRYGSFAPQRTSNDVKWHVDGCSYMWAVSRALEQASQSIWILDWWLSPELYLRRPPSRNEQYRLDRMLQAAAQRGVKINIIVYKEVTQALTRKYLSPTLPKILHSLLPHGTDPITRTLTGLGLAATFASLQHVEKMNPLILPPVTVDSAHTKHALEALHPNISVFRHPDHLPDAQTLQSSFLSSLQNISLSAKTAANLPVDALKAMYGMNEDVVLFWAHHEKLCVVDGKTAFMGGLDLCYGRWDTNQHQIADAHPSNLDDIIFPGQDYNNARIMDFQDVGNWQNNKLDRRDSSRMGWSDISLSLRGPVVEDLRAHFVERWNFIYDEKYFVRKDSRYSKLTFTENAAGAVGHEPVYPQGPQSYSIGTGSSVSLGQYPPAPPLPAGQTPSGMGQYEPQPASGAPTQGYGHYPPPPPRPQQPGASQAPYFPPPLASGQRDIGDNFSGQSFDPTRNPAFAGHDHPHLQRLEADHPHLQRYESEAENLGEKVIGRFEQGKQHVQDQYLSGNDHHSMLAGHFQDAGMPCQIVRSCTDWSHGVPTEHSIANAYISVIENSEYFVYIENQFFITATDDKQEPVKNRIGGAIVDRILRAARAGQEYMVIVIMPAVPAFAGDLKDDSALGTRAIMEFQYNSINRGGYSIMEKIGDAGYDPTQYIRFYNLRNYDRINVGAPMAEMEQRSGVSYEAARRGHDQAVELPVPTPELPVGGHDTYAELPADNPAGQGGLQAYQAYQQAIDLNSKPGLWDSVSSCYMLGGPDIRSVPWVTGNIPEIDAFVSEELYVHSKVLIADDRVVICGSANLNDRSQLGFHDSEIAIIIEDPTPLPSTMNGRPYTASEFAATLRRQLFRKHLGLLPPQDCTRADANSEPIGVPNTYDFGSPEDTAVADPLADGFLALWNSRARTNTEVFRKVFHPVPDDSVKTWADYDTFYEHFFKPSTTVEANGKVTKKAPSKYKWGHVVAEEFSAGEQGVREVKELLARVRGTLVEMPLLFLIKEDIAREGLGLNAFTETVYT